ncbi:polysaccharide pyruvyl transferase family protein [Belnapia sp. T6]|uniref:Polysaccharide pyruvyl transferase family protein n=1 Tax=Belnapia mucosa TaxID=2804532 RepID=A0ABS1V039_9PROT|nr:polysaccharide pyruvyl transferase family protein [Belnapia mucosa]MBL6454446.1 polysaccharide pyruvyl transferase family protein [Belnapia mucosa]
MEGWRREDVVRALYRVVLGREAENDQVVSFHAGAHAAPETLIRALLDCEEARERQRRMALLRRMEAAEAGPLRVLLFGAYGNGNLGDAEQAEAVASLLRGAVARPLQFGACSFIDARPYAFASGRVMPADVVADPLALAGWDLLLIGGGGLFATPHWPLMEPGWAAMLRKIGLAYGLVGIGVGRALRDDPRHGPIWDALLAGAAFRSARDVPSLGAAPGAAWMPDPVLLVGLRAGGGQPRPPGQGARPLIVLKRAVHEEEARFLDWVAAEGTGCDLVAVERWREEELVARFPDLRFVEGVEALGQLCAGASVVVSARYHGCIAALLAGVPCLGVGPGKIPALFEALGARDQALDDYGGVRDRLTRPPAPLELARFAPLQAAGEAALASLGQVMEGLPRRLG